MGIGEFGGTVSGGCIVEERGVCVHCYVMYAKQLMSCYTLCVTSNWEGLSLT